MKIYGIVTEKTEHLPTLYHHSPFLFNKFDISLASPTAIWGLGIYLSDCPYKLGGWKNLKKGYMYEVNVNVDSDKVLDITKPLSLLDIEKIESCISRKLKDPVLPFISIEKRFGNVSNFMKANGYDILIHTPAAQLCAKNHYMCVNPSILNIQNVYKESVEQHINDINDLSKLNENYFFNLYENLKQ